MKDIKEGQVWESKDGVRESSKQTLEIVARLNSKCWQTRDVEHLITGFISSDDLKEKFVIKRIG